MNREILFRGKSERDGKWGCGSLICDYDIDLYMIDGYEYIPSGKSEVRNPFSVIVDIETVGQYTGLKDRNGNRIFEGDILKAVRSDRERIFHVIYSGTAFYAPEFHWELSDVDFDYQLEIIGNIHDNPELLKVGDET